MAVTRRANSKAYDFKSIGTTFTKKAELDSRNNPVAPPVGIATPVALSDLGPNFLKMRRKACFGDYNFISISLD